MDITELAKKASNRTRNANQWLAEGVPDKAKEQLNELGEMLADNIDVLQNGSKTGPEKADAAAEAETVSQEDEERAPEDDGTNQAGETPTEQKESATDQSQQVTE